MEPGSLEQQGENVETLITVNGIEISVADFDRTYVANLMATGSNDTRRERWFHLENLVDAELLYREALDRGLADDSVSQVFRERETKKALGGRFFEKAFLETLQPLTDAQTRQAFALSKEKAVVRHLFYRDSVEANRAWERLNRGVDFLEEATRCYGLSEIDSTAGYLGPVGYFSVDDAFAEAAFALPEPGDFTPPVRTRFGYHIILLEDRILTPIITESEYQTKKAGVASQTRLRKRRLEGDRFVRSFMEELDVVVNPEAIDALNAELELLEKSVVEDEVSLQSPEDLPLRPLGEGMALEPSTPLARYTIGGEERVFTAGQYGFWLPDLPFPEARYRTAASVGRALRNEVFADEAVRRGLRDDPIVEQEVEFQMRIHLAQRLRQSVRADTANPIDPEELRMAYQRIGIDLDAPPEGLDDRMQAAMEGLTREYRSV
jgi:parvulin-like peptidyl-prolyl isomerase